jgi:hypothetical protein
VFRYSVFEYFNTVAVLLWQYAMRYGKVKSVNTAWLCVIPAIAKRGGNVKTD